MYYNNDDLGLSSEPLFAAARHLLREGLADPEDTLSTYRGDMRCMSGKVGVAAGLTVYEHPHGGIGYRKYPSDLSQNLL
jgi:hypothetical protein